MTGAKPTAQDVCAKASEMARRGFDFSANRGAFKGLVRPMLEGGIMLQGGAGTGKSFFFWCAGMPCLSMKIAQVKPFAELERALSERMDDDIVIDDIGAGDDGRKSDYGTGINLLEYILEVRGDTPRHTHMTTNLTDAQLRARYGDDRIVDRLHEFVSVHRLDGCESMRRADGPRRSGRWATAFFDRKPWPVCIRARCEHYDRDENVCRKGKLVMPAFGRCAMVPGLDLERPY